MDDNGLNCHLLQEPKVGKRKLYLIFGLKLSLARKKSEVSCSCIEKMDKRYKSHWLWL